MSSKPISEYDAKRLVFEFFEDKEILDVFPMFTNLSGPLDSTNIPQWLKGSPLVAKPDHLIKRRGKLGLIGLNLNLDSATEWIQSKQTGEIKIGSVKGRLSNFIIEPFFPHEEDEELYLSILSNREGLEILFHEQGGIDIGDVNRKAKRLNVWSNENVTKSEIQNALFKDFKSIYTPILTRFVQSLILLFRKLNFTFLEINPLVINKSDPKSPKIRILDIAAKLDEAAHYQCIRYWGEIDFPVAFGRQKTPEEKFVTKLDGKTGASLKLTLLNPHGRIWTLVAGGGASVIFTDTIIALSGDKDVLGNYGEYSGAPTKSLTYQYAKTVIDLMTKHPLKGEKALLIGGGIANFTNVAETFNGIIKALEEKRDAIRENDVMILVRRGGPNYRQGLEKIKSAGERLGISIQVYGPETNLTEIVKISLERLGLLKNARRSGNTSITAAKKKVVRKGKNPTLFSAETKAVVYGMQPGAVQNMLDFDYLSRRTPSVTCIIYAFATASHYRQFFFGAEKLMIPVYNNMEEALNSHPETDVLVNFASSRSAYSVTAEAFDYPQIRTIGIIAEGVPELYAKKLISEAKAHDVVIVGPATVGMIKPGCFRMGNTGGKTDNLIASRLYQKGSVGYVSRSGGLSNELNNIIAQNCDGVYEGVAIGGDRYPTSTFLQFFLRFEEAEDCKILVLLGEVGGVLEYEVVEALEKGEITKPVVAWCTGTSAEKFPYDVQFGHAGACAGMKEETATAKNSALRNAGAYVPDSFEGFAEVLKAVFNQSVQRGDFSPVIAVSPPKMPIDYNWATKLGIVRKAPNFFSSIAFERNGELNYAGVPISSTLENEMGVGGVIGLLWFKKRLPKYICRFFEMVLMVIADHGPAVSAAHNTIVTARAGKDVISALISGLVTIGPRFGGALDGAAKVFTWAIREGLSAEEFVEHMRKEKRLIMGIGHKCKSLENPDKRVDIIVDYCNRHFKSHETLKYAQRVEKITTRKKSNLILNVDGAIGVCFADCLRSCGLFSEREVDEYIDRGSINALFVLGRSIGLIGHYLDQGRLQQPLYRHPMDDIAIVDEEKTVESNSFEGSNGCEKEC